MAHKKGHDKAGQKANPEKWKKLDAEAKANKAKKGGKAAEILAQMPGREEDEEALSPISGTSGKLPKQYTTPQGVAPRYLEGADYTPASFAQEDRIALQKMLLKGGFLKKGDEIRWGGWDDTTRKAYRDLLETANAAGTDYLGALEQVGSLQSVKVGEGGTLETGGGSSGRKGPVYQQADLENDAAQLKARAGEYLVPLSDQSAMEWAKQMRQGQGQELE